MKAVAYFRVSTAAQGRSGLGLAAQKSAVEDLAGSRGLQILGEFVEVESGKRNDRPELMKALQHAKVTGAVLVIAKLDRLSRNAAFLLTLRESGVRFTAADIPDANDLTIGVLAVIAQAEREAISRRTTEALATIRHRLASGLSYVSPRSGKPVYRLGNPNGADPLRKSNQGNEAAVAVTKIKAIQRAADLQPILMALRSEGVETLHGLAAALNERGILTARGGQWHTSTVRNLLARIEVTAVT